MENLREDVGLSVANSSVGFGNLHDRQVRIGLKEYGRAVESRNLSCHFVVKFVRSTDSGDVVHLQPNRSK